MASNTFGNVFRITTWGESHGKAIGVVIDGCPAGLLIAEEIINHALSRRMPGKNPYTSPRVEPDRAEILSGVFDGVTTGTPISIIIANRDSDSSQYEPIKDILRPGHANFTYLEKYGVFDYRGGGRSSARETACRVAAGAVAHILLSASGISVRAYIHSIGDHAIDAGIRSTDPSTDRINQSDIFCPDPIAELSMKAALDSAKAAGDSLGGIVEFYVDNMPVGLGDPIYEKLEANLAKAMMSLPASKGFELGEGFHSTIMRGSEHNDLFSENKFLHTNHAGGTLGGISTGMSLCGRVAFKPTSSIGVSQSSVNTEGKPVDFQLPVGARHDPCVAIRAVPVVEAMCHLVLADAVLMNRLAKWD